MFFSQANVIIPTSFAQPFPSGDYGNFSLNTWLNANYFGGGFKVIGIARGYDLPASPGYRELVCSARALQDALRAGEPAVWYMCGNPDYKVFQMPSDLATMLAGIPALSSSYPYIGSCTVGGGQGEPTVHVPVNALTATSHSTLTMSGAYNTGTTTDVPRTTTSAVNGGSTATNEPDTQTPQPETQSSQGQTSQGSAANGGSTQAGTTPETAAQSQPTLVNPTEGTPTSAQVSQATSSRNSASEGQTSAQPSTQGQPVSSQASRAGTNQAGQSQQTGGAQSQGDQGQQTQNSPSVGNQASTAQPEAPTSTQNIGGIIASVLGVTSTPQATQASAPAAGSSAANQVQTIDAGGQQIEVSQIGSSSYAINGQTVSNGGVATAAGHVVSVAQSGAAVIIDYSVTSPLSGPAQSTANVASPSAQIYSTAGQEITVSQVGLSSYAVNEQTVTQGGVATAGGHVFSIATSGAAVVIDGSVTSPLPDSAQTGDTAPQAQVYSAAGQKITVSQVGSSSYNINGQTVSAGGVATVGGHTFSVQPSGSVVVIDNSMTSPLQAQPTGAVAQTQVYSTAGQQITVSRVGPSSYDINGQTVSAGGIATVGGHTISVQSSGTAVVIDNSVTSTFGSSPEPAGVLTLLSGSLQYSEVGSAYVIRSQTLAPGSIATISGQTLSLGSSGILVIDGSSTTHLPTSTTYGQGVITLGGSLVTIQETGSEVIVGSQTLVPGAVVTVNGETLSLAPGGSGMVAVSGTQTSTLGSVAVTAEETQQTGGAAQPTNAAMKPVCGRNFLWLLSGVVTGCVVLI
ncbi:hypothetical protein LTR56_002762 [Elasticomyces elasticus]|nr:hypothetical protein LTR56_002762 [Elasticomyces elasticus]KAK3666781.1 hypothetical protein LTR22_002368 [Elasticomyces elasticus]KAK4918805.1 hypothetical protein LTR49_013436 [Elasticomyces elasticus]KAK5758722.1 hypothetical protein LTS12_011116 [Elasticomyces elasticus]